jgi:twitching motility protein PilT
MAELRSFIEDMIRRGASDLHLTVGIPPQFRIDGQVVPGGEEPLSPDDTRRMTYSIMNETQRKQFETQRELDMAFGLPGMARFRANVFLQRGTVAAAIRRIPNQIQSFAELGVPNAVGKLAARHRGLVLVTGPTGSGKSTTLSSVVDKINRERRCHIITLEDPIEYIHSHRQSIVNQREVTNDTESFKTALRYILRQDPDVVLIGEMRDLETIGAALTIAETGHLALATLHTNSTYETINRIVDAFPLDQRTSILAQLSFVLEGVISQQLLPRIGGGRVMVAEVLVCTPAIKAIIREGKIHQIYGLMQAGHSHGMQTMNQSLASAVEKGQVAREEALARTSDARELVDLLSRRKAAATGGL